MKIKNVISRQILDSRGNPTIETDVILESGLLARASVPSGASTGSREAIELRDNNPSLFLGKSVLQAVNNVNNLIKKEIIGLDIVDQRLIDTKMINLDGTENKRKLGANAILSVSLACAKAAALFEKKPLYRHLINSKTYSLPVPMMNVINGGQHADNNIDMQEFMIVPINFESFNDALHCGNKIFHTLKNIILSNKFTISGVGDEGGYAPNFSSNQVAIEMILKSIEQAGYKPGEDVYIALDLASNEFFKNGKYILSSENKEMNSDEMIDYLEQWVNKYPIISIEDPMQENDWNGWKKITERLGNKVQLVGDDLFVTNSKILHYGIENKMANSILIKLNQIGTLTETLETIAMADEAKYTYIISHRSGETCDTTISDLAVAMGGGQIKTGSLCRSDRVSKYNQLLRIEEELSENSFYPGKKAFKIKI